MLSTKRHDALRAAARALCLAGLAAAGAARAAGGPYPSHPITIVVPFQAGGGADTVARLLAQKLPAQLGNQTVVVDNRAGASGNIGASFVARAEADGYTLLFTNNTITINAALDYTKGFDLQKDLKPVALAVSSPVAIGVNMGLPAKNVTELVDWVRKHPKEASFSSCATGSPQHLAGAAFNQYAGTELMHVPYNGCAPAVTAGVGNQVPIMFSTVPNLAPFAADGKLRMVSVTSAKRLSFMPEVPAMAETPLFKDMDITVWFGLFAPAATPAPVRKKLEDAVRAVLADPDVRKGLNARYYEVDARGGEAFDRQVKQDLSVYSQLVKRANIHLE